MRDEGEIWDLLVEEIAAGQSARLLVVAESSGSSPGRPGFKMAVTRDEIRGSVGGGVMEVALVDDARIELRSQSKIQNPKSKIVKMVHRPNVPDASGMICSGSQTVIVCKLDGSDLETVRTIRGALRGSREIGIRITDVGVWLAEELGAPGIVFRDGPPEAGTPGEGGTLNEFIYEEKLGFKPRLFIVGGGHCALALSELMSKLGFRIVLFDDRADLNTLEKNAFADEKNIIGSYDEIGSLIPEGDDVFVVVMTLGYRFDEIVIRRLFQKHFRYFGVLGSKAKMRKMLNSLKTEGFDADRLNRIRTPIGLPINSRTPEEIAVSIAAEIIAVKNDAGG